MLDRGKLTSGYMKMTILPFPDTIAALANKSIDIGYLPEPFAS